MAERLTPRTPDPDVRGLSLARCLVSLDKDVYSILTLFSQVYKMGTGVILLRGGGGG